MTLAVRKARVPPHDLPERAILVVDDVPEIGEFYRAALRRSRAMRPRVVVALRGQTALEVMARERFDLVISDLRIPDLSGVAVLAAARKLQPRARLMLISGRLPESPLAAGDDVELLAKPLEARQVLRQVEALLLPEGEAAAPQGASAQMAGGGTLSTERSRRLVHGD